MSKQTAAAINSVFGTAKMPEYFYQKYDWERDLNPLPEDFKPFSKDDLKALDAAVLKHGNMQKK